MDERAIMAAVADYRAALARWDEAYQAELDARGCQGEGEPEALLACRAVEAVVVAARHRLLALAAAGVGGRPAPGA